MKDKTKKTLADEILNDTQTLDEFFANDVNESPDFGTDKKKMFAWSDKIEKWSTTVDKRLDSLEKSVKIIDDNLNKLVSEVRKLRNDLERKPTSGYKQ
jgi:hypothetical protein